MAAAGAVGAAQGAAQAMARPVRAAACLRRPQGRPIANPARVSEPRPISAEGEDATTHYDRIAREQRAREERIREEAEQKRRRQEAEAEEVRRAALAAQQAQQQAQ
jgi:hypothetical protein